MNLLNSFAVLITQNIFLGILVSFVAGIISSFSPCTIATLPLIIGYISGNKEEYADKKNKNGLKYSLFFSLGIVFTFTVIGAISALLGKSLRIFGNWWYLLLAVILIVVSIQLFDVFPQKKECRRPKLKKNAFGAFLLGILGGFFASPCSTPVLIAIISLIASGGNVLWGIIYMLFYSIGFCTLIIIAGVSLQTINRLATSAKYQKVGKVLRILFGVVTLGIALILLYNIF